MKDSAFKLHQGEWGNSEVILKKSSGSAKDNNAMIKSRLGFIYFVVLVSAFVLLFTR